MKTESIHALQSGLAAVLVALAVGGCLVVEFLGVASVRAETRALVRRAQSDEALASQAAARIEHATRHEARLAALAERIDRSRVQHELSPAQLAALEGTRVTVVRTSGDGVGLGGRLTFELSGDRAEFHRLLPGLAAWESGLALLEWQLFRLELPAGRAPLGLEPTPLLCRGAFTLPTHSIPTP